MSKISLPNGIELDDEAGMAPILRDRIEYNQLQGIRVFLATLPNKTQEYVLVDGERPIFTSQAVEAVWSRIDLMKLTSE